MARMLQALKNLEARAAKPARPASYPGKPSSAALEAKPKTQPAHWLSHLQETTAPVTAGVGLLDQLVEEFQQTESAEDLGLEPLAVVEHPRVDLAALVEEAEDRGQGTGDRGQEAGDRGQEAGVGGWESEIGSGEGTLTLALSQREREVPAVVLEQAVQRFRLGAGVAQSILERSVRNALDNPAESKPLTQLAERLGRDAKQSGSKSIVLVGIGAESSVHEPLLSAAALLANQDGEVLLIDANLARRPISDGLQAGQELGLAELLRSGERPRERCRATSFSRLSLLPAGLLRHADLSAAGSRLEEIVQQLATEFSLVLIDGGRASDLGAIALARLCDATYFVVQLGTVEASEAQAALRDFRAAGARVLGCIAT